MLRKISRLFVIKTPVEAYLIIYALALGAVERGSAYLTQYPGWGGKLLFLACTGAVFMAGAKILDCIKHEKRQAEEA
jgi:4-hydroxybenzoate polyprenyltransferase